MSKEIEKSLQEGENYISPSRMTKAKENRCLRSERGASVCWEGPYWHSGRGRANSTWLCPGEAGGGAQGPGRGEGATREGKPVAKKEISGVGRENGRVWSAFASVVLWGKQRHPVLHLLMQSSVKSASLSLPSWGTWIPFGGLGQRACSSLRVAASCQENLFLGLSKLLSISR